MPAPPAKVLYGGQVGLRETFFTDKPSHTFLLEAIEKARDVLLSRAFCLKFAFSLLCPP